jgi:hypothetical protein
VRPHERPVGTPGQIGTLRKQIHLAAFVLGEHRAARLIPGDSRGGMAEHQRTLL